MTKDEASRTDKTATRPGAEQALMHGLKQVHEQLLDENRQLRELLAARLPAGGRAGDDLRMQDWENQRRAVAERNESRLQDGPSRFQVSHPGDPTRIVGAATQSEAVAKYRGYFGIRQTSHEFVVRELHAAETAA